MLSQCEKKNDRLQFLCLPFVSMFTGCKTSETDGNNGSLLNPGLCFQRVTDCTFHVVQTGVPMELQCSLGNGKYTELSLSKRSKEWFQLESRLSERGIAVKTMLTGVHRAASINQSHTPARYRGCLFTVICAY